MEIIKHGKKYRNCVLNCENCGCEFSLNARECAEKIKGKYIETNCPECGATVPKIIDKVNYGER